MVQSDRSNSIWPNDIITWHSWLVLSCIGSQWARCSTFRYMTSACCSSCSLLQKPSTFPSSTCIDLLWGDSCMLYGGYFMYVICTAAVFLKCSQQHVVVVLAVASLCTYCAFTPQAARASKWLEVIHFQCEPAASSGESGAARFGRWGHRGELKSSQLYGNELWRVSAATNRNLEVLRLKRSPENAVL